VAIFECFFRSNLFLPLVVSGFLYFPVDRDLLTSVALESSCNTIYASSNFLQNSFGISLRSVVLGINFLYKGVTFNFLSLILG